MPQRVALGILGGLDQLDRLAPLGHLGLPRSEHLLLRRHGLGAGRFRLGLGLGLGLGLLGDGDGALLLGQLQGLAPLHLQALDLRSLRMRSPCSSRSVAMRERSTSCAGGDLGLLGLLLLLGALARRLGALAGAAHLELALLVEPGASASRSISSDSFSASRFLFRIWIIVSCSMSLRIFLRRSICSVSWVRPSASKAFDGLKNSILVWSSR